MPSEAMHQIGEVAARIGLSLRTVRYYEEVDLVELVVGGIDVVLGR